MIYDRKCQEYIRNKDFRDFPRGKKRSLSLNNIAYEDIVSIQEKPSFLSALHTGNKLKGLKKKLNIKLSKSNTDLVHAAHNGVKDTNKLDLSYFGDNIIDTNIRKNNSKDQLKKRNRAEICTANDSLIEHSTSSSKLNINERVRNSNPIHHGTSDSSDHSLIYEPVVNSEYVDDLGSTHEHDETDGAVLAADQQIEKLWRKIEKTREDLIQLQAIRDGNVTEYLKITDNSMETTSIAKIKVNFERSNQKTNSSIQLLQKKLEKYLQQVREIEENGGVHGTKSIIKVVQDSVRSGASSITGAVSKPLESFNNFIKKEKKISSTENVYITVTDDDETERSYHSILTTSDEENVSSSASNQMRVGVLENIRRRIMVTTENGDDELDALKSHVEKLEKENEDSKQSIDQFKDRLNWAIQSLQEESYKTEQLQIRLNDLFNQWNDLTELHQNEMMGMKDEMDRTMERIECVEYRFTERTADLEENLENCVTKISKIEKQQHEQQQPIEHLLDMDAKILLSKFLSFIINICVVVIFVISSLTKLVMPFVSNKARLVASGVAVIAVIVLWRNCDHELFNVFRGLFHPLNR